MAAQKARTLVTSAFENSVSAFLSLNSFVIGKKVWNDFLILCRPIHGVITH